MRYGYIVFCFFVVKFFRLVSFDCYAEFRREGNEVRGEISPQGKLESLWILRFLCEALCNQLQTILPLAIRRLLPFLHRN